MMIRTLLSLSCLATSLTAFADLVLPDGRPTDLTPEQVELLTEAARRSEDLEWRVLTTEVGGRPRTVVLLGEYHFAVPGDLELAGRVFTKFDEFAVENGGRHNDARFDYRMAPLAFALMMPATLLSQILGGRELRSPMDLPIDQPGVRGVRNAEILHRPSAGEEFDLALLGAVSAGELVSLGYVIRSLVRMVRTGRVRGQGLLGAMGAFFGVRLVSGVWSAHATERPLLKNRDVDMAKFIDQWIHQPENDRVLVVIVGQLHLKNLQDYLTTRYSFRAGPLTCGPSDCPNAAKP